MKIAVIGVGGVGGYFGGKLTAQNEVIFIARGETLLALRQDGLTVSSIKGDFQVKPVHVTDRYQEVGQCDLVLVCVKSPHLKDVIEPLQHLVGSHTLVLPLLNGVDAIPSLQQRYGEKVIGGFCKIVSFKEEPGKIRHIAVEPTIEIGEVDAPPSPRINQIAEILRSAGITTIVHSDFRAAQWTKMVFISAVSAVGAVMRAPFDEILSIPQCRTLMEKAIQECVAVAEAQEITLPENLVEKLIGFLESMTPGSTASMQRDVMEGKPSELHFLPGAVVRIADELNVDVPVMRFCYYSLLPQEAKATAQK